MVILRVTEASFAWTFQLHCYAQLHRATRRLVVHLYGVVCICTFSHSPFPLLCAAILLANHGADSGVLPPRLARTSSARCGHLSPVVAIQGRGRKATSTVSTSPSREATIRSPTCLRDLLREHHAPPEPLPSRSVPPPHPPCMCPTHHLHVHALQQVADRSSGKERAAPSRQRCQKTRRHLPFPSPPQALGHPLAPLAPRPPRPPVSIYRVLAPKTTELIPSSHAGTHARAECSLPTTWPGPMAAPTASVVGAADAALLACLSHAAVDDQLLTHAP